VRAGRRRDELHDLDERAIVSDADVNYLSFGSPLLDLAATSSG
jgi:hypothetical protein